MGEGALCTISSSLSSYCNSHLRCTVVRLGTRFDFDVSRVLALFVLCFASNCSCISIPCFCCPRGGSSHEQMFGSSRSNNNNAGRERAVVACAAGIIFLAPTLWRRGTRTKHKLTFVVFSCQKNILGKLVATGDVVVR